MNANEYVVEDEPLDFDGELDKNSIADFELELVSKPSKRERDKKHQARTRDRIFQLQEEKRLKKLTDDFYDDWD